MELPKRLKLLVFDFDGTLFHLDELDWDRIRAALDVPPGEQLGEVIQQLHISNPAKLEALTEAEITAVGTRRLETAIVRSLEDLGQHFHVAVLTRNSRRAVERSLQGLSLENKLRIVGREDVRQLKPHPEGLERILIHFGVEPEMAVLTGDTYHDVQAAKSAGLYSVVVRNPRLAYRPEGADKYIGTIPDLVPLLIK